MLWWVIIPNIPLDWAAVVDHHKALLGNKNRDMQSLCQKFCSLSWMKPHSGDAGSWHCGNLNQHEVCIVERWELTQ
jgi:hypothetical protein